MMLLLLAACADDTKLPPSGGPTWHQDVAPILAARCGSCHNSGGLAPFPLDDYATSAPLSAAIAAAVEDGTMPPWLAQVSDSCTPKRDYKDDLRLSPDEIATLRDWSDAGAPEGDAATAAPIPGSPSLTVASPSAELTFPVAYEVKGPADEYVCFILDPGNTTDVWINEVQLVPGNPEMDHHGLVFVDFGGVAADLYPDLHFPCFSSPANIPNYQISTWTPGAVVTRTPAGTGSPLPAGALIVVQMHYHPPGGQPATDQSVLQLQWTETRPTWESAHVLLGNYNDSEGDGIGLLPGPNDRTAEPEFLIPAGAVGHTEEMVYRQETDFEIPIYSAGTHMHFVGTDMKIMFRDDGREECLVHTPTWDFNWQRVYDFDAAIDALPTIGKDDDLVMKCVYDNSMGNRFVADALAEAGLTEPQDVYLGETTLDEMCLGMFGILLPPGLVEQLFE